MDVSLNGFYEGLKSWLLALQGYLPSLLMALFALFAGWLLAKLLRSVTRRFGRGMDALLLGLERRYGIRMMHAERSIANLMGSLIYWLTIALAAMVAADLAGIQPVSVWLQQLIAYLPVLFGGVAIAGFGYVLTLGIHALLRDMAQVHQFRFGERLSHLGAGVTFVFFFLLALDYVGVDVSLLTMLVVVVTASLFVALAIAFGIGAADTVRDILACHYLRQLYRPGQWLRVGDITGEVLEFTTIGLLLETEQGTLHLPARQVLEGRSTALEGSGSE